MNGVYKVSLNESHGLMIKDGNLYSWGFNTFGQLGLGDPGITFQEKPKLVSTSGNWTDISAGMDHSLGICGGYLYSWGNNYYGQLGLTYCNDYWAFGPLELYGHSSLGKTNSIEYSPRKVGGASNWSKISAGKQISFAIKNGFLYGWGKNVESNYIDLCFGIDLYNAYLSPSFDSLALVIIAPIRISTYTNWTDISTKKSFVLGICGGNLLGWNNSANGALGNGVSDSGIWNTITQLNTTSPPNYLQNEAAFFSHLTNLTTGLAGFPTNKTWESVSAGSYHSLGISGGDLYAWGANTNGALGDGTTLSRSIPTLINKQTSSNRWKKVSAGENYSLGLSELVDLDLYEPYSWGTNTTAQLGDGTTNRSLIPKSLGVETYADISAGPYSGAGIESFSGNYKLYTWGWDPLRIPPLAPNILSNPNDKIPNKYKTANTDIKKISTGWNDIYILDKFGNLDYIPIDGTVNVNPEALAEFNYTTVGDSKIYSRITDVAAGFDTAIVAKADNTINIDGRGYNSRIPVAKPYYSQTQELENIPQTAWKKLTSQSVISGVYCGVKDYGIIFDDGAVAVWGAYKKITNYQPLHIKWKQVVSGGDHIVVLTKYNGVYCFGDNTHGQCNVPSGLTGVQSVFATSTASGALLQNGDIVYWGNYYNFDGLDQLSLYETSNTPSYKDTTVALPLNRKYKHNLIGYTFDGIWGEDLYKQQIKNKLQEYYTQLGVYPNKLILNIQEQTINPLRWFNEPATIKYLGYTLNAAGISSANDGVTYQNLVANNYSIAPTRYEDFSKVLQTITDFYSLGYTLAKQAIYEISGDRNSIAVGFNTGQLLPDYAFLGFSAGSNGYTLNYKTSWSTGNTLLNYKEYSNDTDWTPYIIQGPDSYLPVSGFDISNQIYKPYSGTTATNNYYVNSVGVTGAVYTAYYNRWKEFLTNIDFDFVIDNNISKFILPEEISNTPVLWAKTKQIFKDYEVATSKKLNKNLLTSFANYTDVNIGTTFEAVNNGPVLVKGATGISVNLKQFTDSINNSKTTTYDYNTTINNLNVFDISILAILGNTLQQKALDQWYYYGIKGGTFNWTNRTSDSGFTYIDWATLQTEMINETYSVFGSSKPNVNKFVNLLNYFNNLNLIPNNQFDFYNITDVVKIKSGKEHSVLLNRYGKINFLGSTLDNRQNIPDGVYTDISAGDLHTAAINQNGNLVTAGKIITDSGSCSGSTLTVDLTPISGVFDTVESGGNHLALFETGQNKKYYGTVDRVDEIFKRIYVKNYSAADETNISFGDPSGTNVTVVRDGTVIKNIQHKLLSIDSYVYTVQNIINSSGVVQDVSANNGAVWKAYFINSYKNTENNPYLVTPFKVQIETIQVQDIKYLNKEVLYTFENKFKDLIKTENKIDIKISDL